MISGPQSRSKHWKSLNRGLSILIILTLIQNVIGSINVVHAAANLTITPITWNIVGLDSNNVNVGPNNFPVGARVCNTGTAVNNGLVANFVWDDVIDLPYTPSPYINLRSGSLSTISIPELSGGSLANPSCFDFYFEVSVDRNTAAYDTTRRYAIEVSSSAAIPEFSMISTPTPREIYVEHLISQNRNSTKMVSYAPGTGLDPSTLTPVSAGGTLNLLIGNSYTIKLDASTATQGYNQLEDFINFPNTIFQITKVSSYYSANSSGYISNSSDKLYADACLWDMDPTSVTYLSCIGSNGKTGGTISTTYEVNIIGGAGTSTSLNTLIYDFSGSSFHYNSDFSSSSRVVSISSGMSLTKSFSPASIVANGTSTLTLNITNTSTVDITGISLTDPLPNSPAQMVVASPANANSSDTDCLAPSFTPAANDTSITYTGGVAAGSTCTLSVDVTAATLGTYVNTTNELLVNEIGTGLTASANLIVEVAPIASGSCATPVTIAQWTIPTTGTTPPSATTVASGATALAYTNSTQNDIVSGSWRIGDQVSSPTINLATNKYYRFEITTADYTSTKLTFSFIRGNGGPQGLNLYASNSTDIVGVTPTLLQSYTPTTSTQTITDLSVDVSTIANSNGETYFYLVAYNAAGNSGGTNWIGINNISLSGCPPSQTIEKSFSPDPILVGGTSTLTFTLKNYTAGSISNVAFSDTLPTGLQVSSTPNITSTCGAMPSIVAPSTISFSGGTIPPLTATPGSGTCQISVDVTATGAGTFPNTSGYLSITGINLDSKAVDTLTVLDPPVISKTFSPNPIYAGMTSTLTFNIQNPNSDTPLSGVAFTDTFPANLTTAGAPSTTCTSGNLALSTTTQIILTGASLLAGATCNVTVPVTASVINTDPGYFNQVQISSTETGPGNTANDTLIVQTVYPGISILKEVASSPSGPWASKLSVAPGSSIYYRVTIENIGDVPLSSVNITDVTNPVDTAVETAFAGCTWPSVLPVGSSTQDPTATCIKGPFTAISGSNDNTATAHGTFNGTVYNSQPKTATYSTTSLSLDKSVSETSYSAAGDPLHFTYTITNLSDAVFNDVFNLVDTNTSGFSCLLETIPVSLGSTVTLAANNSGSDDTIVCTGTYIVTAFDVSVGSVTNTAFATVGNTRSNTDRVTVFVNEPDLIITKTNDTDGYASVGTPFIWLFRVSNQGPMDALFANGTTILQDELPAGAAYNLLTATPSEISYIACAIDGSAVLTCSASGGDVTIPGISGFYTLQVEVIPSVSGSLSNAAAIVDPVATTISESNEGNNTAGDAVNVSANTDLSITKNDGVPGVVPGGSLSYTILITNAGPTAADGAIFTDPSVANLTVSGVSCGSATSGASCPTSGNTTVALMQGVGIIIPTLPSGGSVTFTVSGTAGASGSIVNTAYINPPSGIIDTSSTNNSATDTDTIGSLTSDLSISKSDSVISVTAGDSISYTIVVSNGGPTDADGAIFTDPAVSNLTVTAVTCDSAVDGAVCPAAGDTTIALLQGTGIIIPTLPTGSSVTFSITGTAGASGSIVNIASIAPPSGTSDPVSGNNSATDTDTINPSADLSITKTDGATNVTAGEETSYTIVVSNSGPSAGDGALFTDPSVSNLTVTSVTCDSTAGGAVCPTIGNTTVSLMQGAGIAIPILPDGGSVTFTVIGTIGASGIITNTATIDPPVGTTDPDSDNNDASDSDTIDPSADLVITKTDGESFVTPGSTSSYTIEVSNSGPSAADGAIFTDLLVTNLTVTSITCGGSSGSALCPDVAATTIALMQSTGIVIPTLPNGGSVTFIVEGTVGPSGSIENVASISPPSGTTDPDADNNSATDTNTITTLSAALTVVKTADPLTFASLGETIEYTYTITNSGNVTLDSPFTINDDQIATVVCPSTPTSLAPLEDFTCTAEDTISQEDLDSGVLVNTATASGYNGAVLITSAETTETITAEQNSILGLAKRVVSGPSEVSGSPGVWAISYEILVHNYGNVSLTNLQVTDDLAAAFSGMNAIGEVNEFSVITLSSSSGFSLNWPGYDGDTDINLLAGSDSLNAGASGTIQLVVQVTPVLAGTYNNSAEGSANSPDLTVVTDASHNGSNPDPDGDKTPGDDNDPTPVTFNATIFDPPIGIKSFDANGYPVLQWTAVWINNSNIVAVSARSTDEIPIGSSFIDDGISSGYALPGGVPAGSTPNGVQCLDTSALTTTTACYYEGASVAFPRGRVIWEGTLGDDFGATNAADAQHEITIIYALTLNANITRLENIVEIDLDANNDGNFSGAGEVSVASVSSTWPAEDPGTSTMILPKTGFAPGISTLLPVQPSGNYYSSFSSLSIEIPKLSVHAEIFGVPNTVDSWDVTWLGQNVGWLSGSAFPTWSGNSVLTGHVWDEFNRPGIFNSIKQLSYGDQILIRAYGVNYTYEVRDNRLITAENIKSALKHEDTSWVTLLTCEGFTKETNSYPYRRIVRAVLVSID